jgi:hypothetical protein
MERLLHVTEILAGKGVAVDLEGMNEDLTTLADLTRLAKPLPRRDPTFGLHKPRASGNESSESESSGDEESRESESEPDDLETGASEFTAIGEDS